MFAGETTVILLKPAILPASKTMKITIDIEETPKIPTYGGSSARGISDITIGVNNSESLSDVLEAFMVALYAMGYAPETINSHISIHGEFLGNEE